MAKKPATAIRKRWGLRSARYGVFFGRDEPNMLPKTFRTRQEVRDWLKIKWSAAAIKYYRWRVVRVRVVVEEV